jgi:hypothetical protein
MHFANTLLQDHAYMAVWHAQALGQPLIGMTEFSAVPAWVCHECIQWLKRDAMLCER